MGCSETPLAVHVTFLCLYGLDALCLMWLHLICYQNFTFYTLMKRKGFFTVLMAFSFGFSLPAISDYRQSLQFQNLNEEKQNIHIKVCGLLKHGIYMFNLFIF